MSSCAEPARSRLYLPGWISFFMLAHFFHHLMGSITVPLLPMIRSEFSLDYSQAGWVAAAFSVTYGLAQPPGGWLADRFGPRVMFLAAIFGVAGAGFAVGLSGSFPLLIVLFALMGVLGGGYHPAPPPLISALVGPENRGRGMGFHSVGGNVSHFLGPLFATLIAASWGWRSSFLLLALPALAFGVFVYLFLGRTALASGPSNPGKGSAPEPAPAGPGRLRRLVAFMFLTNFTGSTLMAASSFIPLFLVDHFGASKAASGVLYSLIFSAGLVASPLGGALSDRIGPVPMILATCLRAGPSLFLLNVIPYGGGTVAVLLLIGASLQCRMPVSESFLVGETSPRNRSLILGIYYFGNIEGSGLLTPAMGALIDRFGFTTSFTVAAVAILAATAVCFPWIRGGRGR